MKFEQPGIVHWRDYLIVREAMRAAGAKPPRLAELVRRRIAKRVGRGLYRLKKR